MSCKAPYCSDPEPLKLDIEFLWERHAFCMSDDLLEMIRNDED